MMQKIKSEKEMHMKERARKGKKTRQKGARQEQKKEN